MKACLQAHKPLQSASQYLGIRRIFSGLTAQLPGEKVDFLLLAVPQPAVNRPEHVGIIVGPDPLVLVGLGQFPLLG